MRACLIAPERFGSLVILGSSADVEDPDTQEFYKMMRDVWVSEGPDGVVSKISYVGFGDDICGLLCYCCAILRWYPQRLTCCESSSHDNQPTSRDFFIKGRWHKLRHPLSEGRTS